MCVRMRRNADVCVCVNGNGGGKADFDADAADCLRLRAPYACVRVCVCFSDGTCVRMRMRSAFDMCERMFAEFLFSFASFSFDSFFLTHSNQPLRYVDSRRIIKCSCDVVHTVVCSLHNFISFHFILE